MFIIVLSLLLSVALANLNEPDKKEWHVYGQDYKNWKHQKFSTITKGNVKSLKSFCNFDPSETPGLSGNIGVTSTISVIDGIAYVTDWSGHITAFRRNKNTGCTKIWRRNVADFIPGAGSRIVVARSAPAAYELSNGTKGIIFGAPGNRFVGLFGPGGQFPWNIEDLPCVVIGLNRITGETLFTTVTGSTSDPKEFTCLETLSYSVHGRLAFGGHSGNNNVFIKGGIGQYNCTQKGNMFAIDIETGSVAWKTYTVPVGLPNDKDNDQYCGGGVWGSSPSIWPEAGLVYYGVGQLYNYTTKMAECMCNSENFLTNTSCPGYDAGVQPFSCYNEAHARGERLLSNAIVAVRMSDGEPVWWDSVQGIDAWGSPCVGFSPQTTQGCPRVPGPDWDFGQAPLLVYPTDEKNGVIGTKFGLWGQIGTPSNVLKSTPSALDIIKMSVLTSDNSGLENGFAMYQKIPNLVASNKGGFLLKWNALTGERIWTRDIGPGSTLGGGHWGIAYNDKTNLIYAMNTGAATRAREGGAPISISYLLADNERICGAGSISAVDVGTGETKWQWHTPYAQRGPTCPPPGAIEDGNSTEVFKNGIPLFGPGGLPSKPINETAYVVTPCALSTTSPPLLRFKESATIHGPVASNAHFVFVPTMHGITYVLDAHTGQCIKQLDCPAGSSYGGVSLVGGEVFVGCGSRIRTHPTGSTGKHVAVFSI